MNNLYAHHLAMGSTVGSENFSRFVTGSGLLWCFEVHATGTGR